MKTENKNIKAPLVGLESWRKDNVPEDVWNNPYLQEYLSKTELKNAIAVAFLSGACALAGMVFILMGI